MEENKHRILQKTFLLLSHIIKATSAGLKRACCTLTVRNKVVTQMSFYLFIYSFYYFFFDGPFDVAVKAKVVSLFLTV